MKIENWPLERFREYDRNPRKNDHAVERAAAAIREFGFRVPVLARSDGRLIDGHLRLKAARALNLTEVPVIIADDMTEAQVKAFRISVNKIADLADWDLKLLEAELAELAAEEYNLDPIGFTEAELAALLPPLEPLDGEPDPDAAPACPAEPVSRPGDLWLLGDHTLFCGDATRAGSYNHINGGGIALVWTDPPYNVDYKGKAGKIKNDKLAEKEFAALLRKAFARCYAALADGAPIYVAHADAGTSGLIFRREFLAAGFYLASCLTWVKNNAVLSRSDYHWRHEPILYGWKPTGPHPWYGTRKQQTVIDLVGRERFALLEDGRLAIDLGGGELVFISGSDLAIQTEVQTSTIYIDKPQKSVDHPTMKPVALIERFLVNSSKPGDSVLDPFAGSGSTLIACERRQRRCHAIELDPKYCDVIVTRWQDYTEKDAIHQSSGLNFQNLRDHRKED